MELLVHMLICSNDESLDCRMCLERCNFTSDDITQHLSTIENYSDIVTAVSFEAYNLGEHGSLILNNLSTNYVNEKLQSMGIERFAMVSSYPYPPDFLDWMRELFRNPTSFVSSLVGECLIHNYTGVNIDFEPTAKATAYDAEKYAEFLALLSKAMHSVGCQVTVDASHWSTLWNYTLLASSGVDRLCSMATYATERTTWLSAFQEDLSAVDLSVLGVGLEVVNATSNVPLALEEVQFRFENIDKYDVQEIDVWDMPLSDAYWECLRQWKTSEGKM